MKRCYRCGQRKSLFEFYRNLSYRDGLVRACKECCRAKLEAFRAANREHVRAQLNSYRHAAPEKWREYMRAWRKAHPERIREYRSRERGKCVAGVAL